MVALDFNLVLTLLSSQFSFQRAVKEESSEFNDVIVNKMVDTYRNMTLKTLGALEWAKL